MRLLMRWVGALLIVLYWQQRVESSSLFWGVSVINPNFRRRLSSPALGPHKLYAGERIAKGLGIKTQLPKARCKEKGCHRSGHGIQRKCPDHKSGLVTTNTRDDDEHRVFDSCRGVGSRCLWKNSESSESLSMCPSIVCHPSRSYYFLFQICNSKVSSRVIWKISTLSPVTG